MKFLLIRHGEIPSNVNKVYAGRSDESLTEKGIQQAEKLAAALKSYTIQALYSSPIKRAFQTAEIIGHSNGLRIQVNDAFREMEMGPWEGLSEEEVALTYMKEWKIWMNRPAELNLSGRETLDQLLKRVLQGVKDIYQTWNGKTVVVVTHVAIIRVLLLWHSNHTLNLYKIIHVPNAEVFELEINSCP